MEKKTIKVFNRKKDNDDETCKSPPPLSSTILNVPSNIQQSLAKYSGLRMTQTVYGCGLALRVVCVNFLNTCPIAP